MPPRKRLGQLLTEMKIVDEHQLQSALGHQKQWGGKLGAILVQKGFCREDQVVAALSQHLAMPAVRLRDVKVDPRAVKMVSKSVAERLHVFAYEVTGSGRSEVITIAMSDPTDLSAVDQLAFHTGKRIKPMLAGDSEVLAYIQQHYAQKAGNEAQPAAAPGARPFMDGAKAPGAVPRATPMAPMAPVAAASAVAAIPRPPAPAPPAPPPAAPRQPDASAPESAAEALAMDGGDLPADAPMDGLEPIAAQTQGEMNVEGGEGLPAGFDAEAASDEPVPLEDRSALQGWAEGTPEGVPLETANPASVPPPPEGGWSHAPQGPDSGWAVAPASGWGEPTVPPMSDQATDELPIDAIMGTADVLEHASDDSSAAADAPAADAPDAWSDISDPLAANTSGEDAQAPDAAPAGEEEPPQDGATTDHAWQAAAAAIEAATEEERRSDGFDDAAPTLEEAADQRERDGQGGESLLAPPDDSPAPADEVSIDTDGWSDDPGAAAGRAPFSMSSPADEPPAEADAEASFDVDMQESASTEMDALSEEEERPATQRHGWLLRHTHQSEAGESQAEQESGGENGDEYGSDASQTEHEAYEQSADEAQSYEQQNDEQQQYAQQEYQQESYAQREGYEEQQPQAYGEPQADESAPGEGWTASADPQSAAWFGDALSSTTPLSPADLGTLASLGLDPADGAAAQRMLACLVRVLNRRQAIDLEELAAEIRQSQMAADAAAQMEGEEQPAGDPDASPESADEPA